MDEKLLSVFATLFIVIFSGCASDRSEDGRVRSVVLGREIESYYAPKEAAGALGDEPGPADRNEIMTLPRALSLALMHNPKLKTFAWEVRASEARALQASVWPNPEFDLEVEEVGGAGDRSGFDGAETTVQLSQFIELGDKRGKRTKVASLENDISQWDYEARRLDVFTSVVKAFTETLAAQERLRLAEDMLQLSGELAETVSQRVDAGKDSPLEETKAAVVVANARIRHQQALKYLELSRMQLAATWGSTAPRFEKVSGLLSVRPIPAMDELAGLTEQNVDVVRSSLEVDREKAALELEKAKAVSDITLSGGLQRFEEAGDNAIVFGISVPLPVSDRNQGGRAEAAYNLARAREEQRATRTRIEVELASAYHALSNAYAEAYELDQNVVQNAERVFDASREGYSQGKLDYLNLLDAQRTFFEAKARYIDALSSYHLARADVEHLIGCGLSAVPGVHEVNAQQNE
ncbi:MAG: TolC family protein [Phycisphaerales bacterium]|nr:MAG: TolC family protein [Phycisphaerales bacterium]